MQCDYCLAELDTPVVAKSCKEHNYHAACLEQWNHHSCPQCCSDNLFGVTGRYGMGMYEKVRLMMKKRYEVLGIPGKI